MLNSLKPSSQSDQIQSLLQELVSETIDLPVERKERIEATLQKIRSCVSMLAPNNGKETLAEGDAKFRELADIITDPFTVWDGDLRMVYRNKASAETTRIPDEQALGRAFPEIYPSLAGSEVHQVYIRALETHQPQRIRSHWVRPSDGNHLYHDLTIYPTSTGVCAFSKNVTDLVRAEMAQREALELATWMARIPDENPGPVARVSVDGKILYCNRVSSEPSGWNFQVGEQIPGPFFSLVEEANRQGKKKERDLQVGESIYSIVVMPYPNDQYVNLYGQDITVRKRAEGEVRESEARFRALTSASSQVFYRMSPDWSEMRQLQGGGFLANTEKPNRNWMAEYIHPDDQEWVRAVIENAVRSRTVFDLEHRVLRADGSLGWTASRAVPVWDDDGEIIEWFGAASDITERKRAEEQLRFQASIFEILHEPIIISDLQMKITSWNPAAERTYGWKEAEVIGKTTRELFRPEVSDEARAAAIRGLKEGKPVITETVMYTKDNRQLIVSGYSVPLKDKLGNVIGYAAATWDITERKIADAALKKANQDLNEERNRLQAVMEALPIGISILDRNGGLIQNNKAFDAVWNGPLPPTTSIADYEKYRAWWVETGQLVQPEEWAASLAVQKGETVTGQFIQIQRFDGSRAYVLNSGAPIWNAEGEIVGSAVAIMDISQWIEAENALRESEQHFRAAVNSAPILVYECDRDLRYTWISNPYRGFRAEEVIGKRDDEVLPPEAVEQLIAAKQVALETEQGRAQEVKLPINGEDTYYILTTDPIRDQQGNVTGLTCSVIDITEQKRLQREQQEQAIQIEVQRRLMAQREQDRHAIARDLHDGPIQMLSSTMFQLHMIKEVFPDPALEKELSQLGVDIKGTIQQLRDILNELRPPALIHFGFSKVARMFIEDFRDRFPEIETELEVVEDDTFLSNDTHLTLFRIFQAGINNIVRHSDASKVWVVFKIEQDCFTLEIRDNGKGFELSQDLSQLTRHGHYGLVGMKERANAINAEFSVISAPGKGTKILVNGPCSGKNLRPEPSRLPEAY